MTLRPIARSFRVVFVAPFGLGQKTTVWARVFPLARNLSNRSHHVSVLIPPWDTPEDAGKTYQKDGIQIENMYLGGSVPAVSIRLLNRIASLQPDIVHVVKPRAYAGIVQWCLWQRRNWAVDRTRLVLDVDDWEQAWDKVTGYSWPLRNFLRWQEEWGIRHADGVTAASSWLVHRVRQTATMPVLYLPNGVDPVSEPPCPNRQVPAKPPHVLFFSRFIEVSPDWLTDFWRELRRRQPQCRLVIVGKALQPHREHAYRSQFSSLSPEDVSAVDWLGYVPPTQLPDLFSTIDCAIFPASPEPLQLAKCSVRMATTLLAGVPVVASSVGEQAAYGANGAASLVPADAKPAEFAASVDEVLCDHETRSNMLRSAHRKLVTEYDWSLLTARLETFYDSIVGASGRSPSL